MFLQRDLAHRDMKSLRSVAHGRVITKMGDSCHGYKCPTHTTRSKHRHKVHSLGMYLPLDRQLLGSWEERKTHWAPHHSTSPLAASFCQLQTQFWSSKHVCVPSDVPHTFRYTCHSPSKFWKQCTEFECDIVLSLSSSSFTPAMTDGPKADSAFQAADVYRHANLTLKSTACKIRAYTAHTRDKSVRPNWALASPAHTNSHLKCFGHVS